MENILGVILAPSVGKEDKQVKSGIKSAESDNIGVHCTVLDSPPCSVMLSLSEQTHRQTIGRELVQSGWAFERLPNNPV